MAEMMNDLERRVIGNLSIPRNVEDLHHVLRQDPAVQEPDPGDLHKLLELLAKDGHVVNMGEYDDLAKMVSDVQKSKTARTIPDESAEIFVRRLADPYRAWRVKGDVWMMTQDGTDAVRAIARDRPSDPFTTSRLKEAIQIEHARVHIGPIEADTTLADKLLPEEFKAWLDAVLAAHARIWGKGEAAEVKKSVPASGGAGWTDTYENYILDHENQKTSLATNDAITSTWYMALVETTAITDASTGSTLDEPEYTGYARKSVAAADMTVAASGSANNGNAITFAACTALTDDVIGFGNCAAATVGLLKKYGTCTTTTISTTQTPATFNPAAYVTTAD